jgi:hypothetical protein
MSAIFSKPKAPPAPVITEVKTPTVNQEIVDRTAADIMRRRRGTQATIGTGSMGTTAGSVAGKQLLGE